MSAERPLELFRRFPGDAFLESDGVVHLSGPTACVEAVRRHVVGIGKPALVAALKAELAAAHDRIAARRRNRVAATAPGLWRVLNTANCNIAAPPGRRTRERCGEDVA